MASFFFLVIANTALTEPLPTGTQYIDNGVIRLGMNLDLGGAITYLAPSGKPDKHNIINNHDPGRQVQMSFYSGPVPFSVGDNKPSDHWEHIGWNPIQAGDAHGNGSEVVDFRKEENEAYVKCIPLHWPLDNVPGECTFETWVRLEENRAHVRCRFVNARTDKTAWPPRSQELPAVYTNGPYYRLMTYTGDAPWTDGPLSRIENPKTGDFPWNFWTATENWAALVNDDNWGLGLYHPGVYHWIGGFAGKPGKGGTHDAPCGYMAPLHTEQLDHNITYAYAYVLMLDSLDAIRNYVRTQAEGQTYTSWRFDQDRNHWVVLNGTDQGWPITGAWSIDLRKDTTIESPRIFWKSEDPPVVEIEATLKTGQKSARICWRGYGENGFPHCVPFDVTSSDTATTYRVPLPRDSGYTGTVEQLRLSVPGAEAGDNLRIQRIRIVAAGKP